MFSNRIRQLVRESEESVPLTPRQVAIRAKLGAANRSEAVAIALRKHLLKI